MIAINKLDIHSIKILNVLIAIGKNYDGIHLSGRLINFNCFFISGKIMLRTNFFF